MPTWDILPGDAIEVMRGMEPERGWEFRNRAEVERPARQVIPRLSWCSRMARH